MESLERYRLTSADIILHRCPACGHGMHGATGGHDNNFSYTLPYPHRADCPVRARIAYHEQTGLSLRTATALALIETDHG
jgi:hypothetical protein